MLKSMCSHGKCILLATRLKSKIRTKASLRRELSEATKSFATHFIRVEKHYKINIS